MDSPPPSSPPPLSISFPQDLEYQELTTMHNEVKALSDEIRVIEERINELRELHSTKCANRKYLRQHLRELKASQEREKRDWGAPTEHDALISRLRNKLGIESWRPLQKEVINAVLAKRDCFVVMPTGAGKSLCYQLPAIARKFATVVVSPLISLIEDQIRQIRALGYEAHSLSGQFKNLAYKKLLQMSDEPLFIFATPEKISKSKPFLAFLENLVKINHLTQFVIDEAHCCSSWGHDFRPDYNKLSVLRRRFPTVPILALTATATKRVQLAVTSILNIPHPEVFIAQVNRPNIEYEVRRKPTGKKKMHQALLELLKEETIRGVSGIVYCFSRNECEEVSSFLVSEGIRAKPYHAGLDDDYRARVHSQWSRSKIDVAICTTAFGMGINKLDVRFVIHYTIPQSLENFYQESGRAGRDRKPSRSVTFYSIQDIQRASSRVFDQNGGLSRLYQVVNFCEGNECRRATIRGYFGEAPLQCDSPQERCDFCSGGLETLVETDLSEEAKEVVAMLRSAKDKTTLRQLVLNLRKKSLSHYFPVTSKSPFLANTLNREKFLVFLLTTGLLQESFNSTAFSTNAYIQVSHKASLLENGSFTVRPLLHNIAAKNKQAKKPVSKKRPLTSSPSDVPAKKTRLTSPKPISLDNDGARSSMSDVIVIDIGD